MDAINQPLLSVRDLSVAFRQQGKISIAVDRISFEIKRGECVALVGESGSGKSVSALSVLKLLPYPAASHPTGSIRFKGRELLSLSESAIRGIRGNDISIIFQEPMTSLNPVYTVGDQIAEVIQLHQKLSRRAALERAIEMLALVQIPNPSRRVHDYPHHFSGGMRQRVMIAMALSCNPKLLIADEPTTALDVTIQAQILELMKDLTRRLNVALIIITHNLGVVARYANRVNVMYAGRLVESGPATEVYHNPRHPYTMALLRSVPRLDRPRQARLDPVEGQPPDLTRLDGGCSFRPRCRFAVDDCARARPPLQPSGGGTHLAACFRSNEIAIETAEPPRQLQPARRVAAS